MHGHSAPRFVLRLAAGGHRGAAGGVPVPRLPARGHGCRGAGLPRRRRRRGWADPARDADAERRRRAAPLRLEPLQLGVPRPGPLASHPARLPLIADQRDQRRGRSAPAAGREGDRARRARRKDRLHASAHGPLHAGRQHRREHARRCGRRRGRRFRGARRKTFEVKGRWENGGERPPFNYDFWYQPRKNVLISSEFGEPNAFEPGFDLEDVGAGRYGSRLHFWNLDERRLEQTIELGEAGLVPLEVRWLHDPEADEGFVGAALSSTMWRFQRTNGSYEAQQVIAVEPVELEGWPFPVPGLITDLVLSMDDRFLYLSNWLHGDLRQYDVSDPAQAAADRAALARRCARQPERRRARAERRPADAPALVRRAPALRDELALLDLGQPVLPGASLVAAPRGLRPEGGMEVDRDFFVDFHDRPSGPARAHEVRLQGGDCTTEIFP